MSQSAYRLTLTIWHKVRREKGKKKKGKTDVARKIIRREGSRTRQTPQTLSGGD
jgi:hypothetical protein